MNKNTADTSDAPVRSSDRAPAPPRFGVGRGAVALLVGVIGVAIGAALAGPIRGAADRMFSSARPATAPLAAGDTTLYTCGMHPWVVLPEPGLCPICHMALTPLDPGRLAGHIVIDPVTVQNIGVRSAPVTRGPVTRTIRTVATVSYDATRVRVATTRIAGWIETLHVAAEGQTVAAGDPLFELYAPDLYAAESEYLLAYRGRDAPGGRAMVESAAMRLEYLGLSTAQIRALRESGRASRTMTIHSPYSGVVTELLVRQGARIEPGTPTHRIADLSRLWLQAAVYEHQMPFVRPGQSATITVPFVPGRALHGTVALVYPYLDAASRQGRVRIELDNSAGLLKPGMFAGVELAATSGSDALLAPREAVLVTGRRSVAFVSLGQGRFEAREVTTGVTTGDGMIEIVSGLHEGERVVTSGQFLLDSESRMKSALAAMTSGAATDQPAPPAPADAPADAPAGEHDHRHHDAAPGDVP